MRTRRWHANGMAALLFGGLLIFVGGYYFLRNNLGFDLGELDGELLWPAIVVILGALLVVRGLGRQQHPA
jgi:hypothetical protein